MIRTITHLLTWCNVVLWSAYLAMKGVNWFLQLRIRYWTEPLRKKNEYNEWLGACLVAQHEKNIVLEAEIICAEALLDGDR
jgi:hypothetical protein